MKTVMMSAGNSDESLVGVYEHDAEVGYFYLYDLTRPEGRKVTGAVRISVAPFQDMFATWLFGGAAMKALLACS